MNDSIPLEELVRRRLSQKAVEDQAKNQARLDAQSRKFNDTCKELIAIGAQIIIELNRLGWPDATMRNPSSMTGPVLYKLNEDLSISPDNELYTLPYLGDGETGKVWQRASFVGFQQGGCFDRMPLTFMHTLSSLKSI